MFNLIHKWLHNKIYKDNPVCPCGWNMVKYIRKGFDYYWMCKWKECTWEAWSLDGGKIKWWR